MWPLHRGRFYLAKLGDDEPKYFLVVSNNLRNRKLDSVITVRVTSTDKSGFPAGVKLSREDTLEGWVYCDDIVEIWEDEVMKDHGAATPNTMASVEVALCHALGIAR